MERGRTAWRLLTVVQMRDCGGSGGGEKWMDVRYSFKVESIGLAEGLDMGR